MSIFKYNEIFNSKDWYKIVEPHFHPLEIAILKPIFDRMIAEIEIKKYTCKLKMGKKLYDFFNQLRWSMKFGVVFYCQLDESLANDEYKIVGIMEGEDPNEYRQIW